ncbi:MAG: TonB-dependent receptor [Sphingomonadaceae bacterium]|nr:TonB-dependent receptor [Sphingomonadaceae bacterium]
MSDISRRLRGLLLCAPAMLAAVPLHAEHSDQTSRDPVLTDVIVVTAARDSTASTDALDPPATIALPPDAAAIAARTAGGALVGNGALSGQLSYRGLSGERVLGRINGQRFATGGPNAMDPPLHYAPAVLLERIEIARGVAPVSQGPGLAGALNAVLLQPAFGTGPALAPTGTARAHYRSVDDSYAVGGMAGLASDRWRLGLLASREEGDDYAIPGGTAGSTSFERNLYGAVAGFRTGAGELFVEYRRSETDPSGNPPFALDIVYFNTDFVQGGFTGSIARDVTLDVRLGHVAVRHLMDNQTVRRPAAPAAMARATFADANTMTAETSIRLGGERRHIKLGVDAELTDKFVRITNPFNAGFFIDAQPQLRSERVGAFAEWRGGAGLVELEAGARLDRVSESAGLPQLGAAVPAGPRTLAAQFVASDRVRRDTVVDAVIRAWAPGEVLTPRLTLARKTRVPSLLERFAWLPTEASYGLADGNIYVGNRALEPEVAWIAEAGFDLETGGLTLRPTLFYRRVDDYIQGTPFDATPGVINSPVEMVANMGGDATPLMFRNVDAELYGVDVDFDMAIAATVRVEGTASYVRAKRRDIADNLYRVAPASGRLAFLWQPGAFTLGAEVNAAARQGKVSATNSEAPSKGYAVVGLFGEARLGDRLTLAAGVENLFDTLYRPHLSGFSRVGASDVPVGTKQPGAGRGVWARIGFDF